MGICDLIEVGEYIDFPFASPMAEEESGDAGLIDVVRQCWGNRGGRHEGGVCVRNHSNGFSPDDGDCFSCFGVGRGVDSNVGGITVFGTSGIAVPGIGSVTVLSICIGGGFGFGGGGAAGLSGEGTVTRKGGVFIGGAIRVHIVCGGIRRLEIMMADRRDGGRCSGGGSGNNPGCALAFRERRGIGGYRLAR